MKPFPKVVGVLGVVAAIFGVLNAATIPAAAGCVVSDTVTCAATPLLALLPPAWGAVIAAVGSVVTMLSHSLTGTGGK